MYVAKLVFYNWSYSSLAPPTPFNQLLFTNEMSSTCYWADYADATFMLGAGDPASGWWFWFWCYVDVVPWSDESGELTWVKELKDRFLLTSLTNYGSNPYIPIHSSQEVSSSFCLMRMR